MMNPIVPLNYNSQPGDYVTPPQNIWVNMPDASANTPFYQVGGRIIVDGKHVIFGLIPMVMMPAPCDAWASAQLASTQ